MNFHIDLPENFSKKIFEKKFSNKKNVQQKIKIFNKNSKFWNISAIDKLEFVVGLA